MITDKTVEIMNNNKASLRQEGAEQGPQSLIQNQGINLYTTAELLIKRQETGAQSADPLIIMPAGKGNYLRRASWFWIIIGFCSLSIISIFTIPDNAFPLIYIRFFFGVIFLLFLPGYSLIRALFSISINNKIGRKSLDTMERIELSLGLSLALLSIVGLTFNYSPWGISLTPITISMLVLTMLFASIAIAIEIRNNELSCNDR